VSGSSLPCGNVDPVGITSTPVVDPDVGRVYVVAMVQPSHHVLFALELSTGRLVDSRGIDANGADPAVHNQRAALSFSGGKIFVPFGGRFGDCGDFRGRVVAASVSSAGIGTIDSYTLPTQGRGGFWSPPGAAVASDGSLYLASGNSTSTTTFDYGNSVVRLSPDLKLLDSFAPRDWADLDSTDVDLGATSPVLLPNDRILQVGKSGEGYLLDAQRLGGVDGQLRSRRVCHTSAFGGIAHDGDTAFVPCSDAVVQVVVDGEDFRVGWSASVSVPGPSIVTNGMVWTVGTSEGDLIAFDASSGNQLFSRHVGSVPSRFTSPAAGAGLVMVAADRTVHAFGQ
jgi:outer membrane protein assembly factor BamB